MYQKFQYDMDLRKMQVINQTITFLNIKNKCLQMQQMVENNCK